MCSGLEYRYAQDRFELVSLIAILFVYAVSILFEICPATVHGFDTSRVAQGPEFVSQYSEDKNSGMKRMCKEIVNPPGRFMSRFCWSPAPSAGVIEGGFVILTRSAGFGVSG